MKRAQPRDAISENKFWFRKSVFPGRTLAKHDTRSRPASPPIPPATSTASRPVSWNGNSVPPSPTSPNGFAHVNGNGHALSAAASEAGTRPCSPTGPVDDEYEEMTVDEIINGKVSAFRPPA